MSFLAGGRGPAPAASSKTGKGSRGKQRSHKSRAVDCIREQIASCEKRISDVREAEVTLKALKIALASLEGK